MRTKSVAHPIQVRKLSDPGRTGYHVLASWKCPDRKESRKRIDSWVPVLAPSHILLDEYNRSALPWEQFSERYLSELRSPLSQDLLKPFALLSLRQSVVLLCDCGEPERCPTRVLARAMEECRDRGVFILEAYSKGNGMQSFPVHSARGTAPVIPIRAKHA
jgi:uncharacterized protein YeaO (DUF488 family)